MNANELRIGNWVKPKYSDTEAQIEPCDFPFIAAQHYELFPIPLTEEWLEMFGFVKFKSDTVAYDWLDMPLCEIAIKVLDGTSYQLLSHNEVDGKCWHLKNVYYVHELQNLYFALTGEEL